MPDRSNVDPEMPRQLGADPQVQQTERIIQAKLREQAQTQ